MVPIFYATIKDAEIVWPRSIALKEYLTKLEGKKVMVTIQVEKSKRSLDQNALYWFWLNIISNDQGNTANELHDIFRRLFLPPIFIEYKGQKIKVPRSTTELSISEFSEYLERVNQEAAELGIVLPTPQDVV